MSFPYGLRAIVDINTYVLVFVLSIDFSYPTFTAQRIIDVCNAVVDARRRHVGYDTHDLRLSEQRLVFSGALTPVDKDEGRKFRAERDADVFTSSARGKIGLRANNAHTRRAQRRPAQWAR